MTKLPEIEDGIPLPRTSHYSRWGFDRMKVGQSMLVEGAEDIVRARRAAGNYAKTHGWKMKTQTSPQGLRIWRVE